MYQIANDLQILISKTIALIFLLLFDTFNSHGKFQWYCISTIMRFKTSKICRQNNQKNPERSSVYIFSQERGQINCTTTVRIPLVLYYVV